MVRLGSCTPSSTWKKYQQAAMPRARRRDRAAAARLARSARANAVPSRPSVMMAPRGSKRSGTASKAAMTIATSRCPSSTVSRRRRPPAIDADRRAAKIVRAAPRTNGKNPGIPARATSPRSSSAGAASRPATTCPTPTAARHAAATTHHAAATGRLIVRASRPAHVVGAISSSVPDRSSAAPAWHRRGRSPC